MAIKKLRWHTISAINDENLLTVSDRLFEDKSACQLTAIALATLTFSSPAYAESYGDLRGIWFFVLIVFVFLGIVCGIVIALLIPPNRQEGSPPSKMTAFVIVFCVCIAVLVGVNVLQSIF
jgi:hypothetical protein